MSITKRGGRRPGAGRHPVDPHLKKVQYRFYIEKQFVDELDKDPDAQDRIIAYIKRNYKPKVR